MASADIVKQAGEFDKDHCWQYEIRLRNLERDLVESNLTKQQVENISVSNFTFKCLTSDDERESAKNFIVKHEWLGNLSQFTTHWFGAYYHNDNAGLFGENVLAGVILMNVPNSFSKMMGENTKDIERLISRGACVSWSPKNLASSFLMWCIKWMVKNTQFRLFTAYSDPMAKELGTIYQACNFYYLGNKFGAETRFYNPYNGKIVSDRFFRQKTAFRKYAKELNIDWQKTWMVNGKIAWDNIPEEMRIKLKEFSKQKQKESKQVKTPSKHKYAMVLGATKSETKKLKKLFESMNKIHPYPKTRGI